jgi:hypothetical protein
MANKIGRPRRGKQIKEHVSIRLEPSVKKRLAKDYGSIQGWIDFILSHDKTIEELAEIYISDIDSSFKDHAYDDFVSGAKAMLGNREGSAT